MPNAITLIHVDIPLIEPFRISSGEVRSKDSILIRIDLDGLTAFGEASPMSGGFYSSDTPDSTWDYLLETVIPEVLDRKSLWPQAGSEWSIPVQDNPFAWAGMEGAYWDLTLQQQGQSFPDYFNLKLAPIKSGLAVGIYPTIDRLIEACDRYLKDGYRRLKIKIEPGWDIEPLRAARDAFGDIPLMVDANAAYREDDLPVFREIDTMGLMMIEQPLAKDQLEAYTRLQAQLSTPVCLDESAMDIETVRRAIEMRACQIVNLKIQRLGGIKHAIETNALCAERGIPTWVGTMPELGIGAVHALYLALLPNCAYPTDVEASSRWFVDDIIDPPIKVEDGIIDLPAEHRHRPNVNQNVIDKYTKRQKTIPL